MQNSQGLAKEMEEGPNPGAAGDWRVSGPSSGTTDAPLHFPCICVHPRRGIVAIYNFRINHLVSVFIRCKTSRS